MKDTPRAPQFSYNTAPRFCHLYLFMFTAADDSAPECEVADGCVEVRVEDDGSSSHALSKKIAELKSELRQVKKQNRSLLKAKARQEGRISKLFKPDQLKALSRVNMRGVHWSSHTVKKALQLRFACGAAGYKVILIQQYPLPSERTLQRRLQNIPFEPGVLTNVFEMLERKVKEMKDKENICCLILDELSLTQQV